MLQLGVNVFSKYVTSNFAYIIGLNVHLFQIKIYYYTTDIAFRITELLDFVQRMVF
jgi:hypothetical protein